MKIMTKSKKTDKNESGTSPDNVLQILHKDHQDVAEMFFQYSQLDDDSEKKKLVSKIIKSLTIHAKAEEELVYPAARKAEDTEDMMDEADTEHHVVKLLLAELSEMVPNDDHYDSKVTVLCEVVNHHVQEEEKEIFAKLEESGVDLDLLGEKLLKRKAELATEMPKEKAPTRTISKSNSHKKQE